MVEEKKVKIRWGDFEWYSPIRIRISDWKHLTIVKYGKDEYMLVDCIMEHGSHPFELLVPYYKFVRCLRDLKSEEQQLIIQNKAIIQIMKTFRSDNFGMKITKVDEILPLDKSLSNHINS